MPLVSPWTGNVGLSWNIFGRSSCFDANVRYFSQRYLDGNEINANAVYFIPATTLVDLRIGGELDTFFWSLAVQNVFDRQYYDYALDTSFQPVLPLQLVLSAAGAHLHGEGGIAVLKADRETQRAARGGGLFSSSRRVRRHEARSGCHITGTRS